MQIARSAFKCFCFSAAMLLVPAAAIAQVKFSTTTYAHDNLWHIDGPPNTTIRVDLNGDGREDFISQGNAGWGSGCSAPGFAVTLSTGDGVYAAPVCYALPVGYSINFAAGDFYGTGMLDVAVANDSGDLYIYKNASGNGKLTLAGNLTLAGEASGLVAADVNHDGHMDLVYDVGNNNTGGGGTLYTLLGYGDGAFRNGPTTTFTMNNEPAGSLAVGDFDGDGKSDLMVIGVTLYAAEILYGDDTGNFTKGPILGTSLAGASSAVLTWYGAFDVDSNGIMDLIGAPFTSVFCGTGCFPTVTPSKYLDLEWGHANRTLSSQKIPLKSCAESSSPPQIGDFDGDGIADLIVAEDSDCKGDGPYTFNFLKGKGNGIFGPEQVLYTTSDDIANFFVMRASHSSKPDLTVYQFQDVRNTITNPEELVLINTTSGNFPPCTPLNNGATGINICGPTSTVGATSPVSFSFAGSNQTPGRDMEIWVDGKKVAENLKNTYSHYSFINDQVSLSSGEHQVAVFSVGWDYSLLLTEFPLLVGSDTCAAPATFAVNVCSPLNDSTLTSPVLAYAAGSVESGKAIVRMEVWVDGVKKDSTFGSHTLKASLSLAPGWHQFTYYIVDNSGNKASKTYYAAVK